MYRNFCSALQRCFLRSVQSGNELPEKRFHVVASDRQVNIPVSPANRKSNPAVDLLLEQADVDVHLVDFVVERSPGDAQLPGCFGDVAVCVFECFED